MSFHCKCTQCVIYSLDLYTFFFTEKTNEELDMAVILSADLKKNVIAQSSKMSVLYREHHVDDHGRHIRAINEADEGIALSMMS